ncbi:MAG: hypothetical protein V3S24_06115 [Candidatus Tectomicrobia bacterium]
MRYQVTTTLTPPEALDRTLNYFGPRGLGLKIISHTHHGAVFQGGGGYVGVVVQPGTITTLEIETREWDYPVQKFMAEVHRPHRWWHRLFRRKRRPAPPPPSFTILNN